MKLSNRYVLREVSGKGVLMPERVTDASLRTASGALRAITLSGSAFWMLKSFEGREFSLEDAVDAVCGHYEADRQPDFDLMLRWDLSSQMIREGFHRRHKVLQELRALLEDRGIAMLLLKGETLADNYPQPKAVRGVVTCCGVFYSVGLRYLSGMV